MTKIIKIVITLLLIFLFGGSYANTGDTNIILSSSLTKLSLNDTFNLTFSVNLESGKNLGEVKIDGIDKFTNLGQNSSFRFESINGLSKSVQEMLIKLEPKEKGKFIIGPLVAKIGDKTIKSNTIEIEVTGGVNNTQNNNIFSNNEDKELSIDDINDIKGPKNTLNIKLGFIIIFLIIVLIIVLYFIYKNYNHLKNQEISKEKLELENKSYKNNYFIEKLQIIEKNIDKYNKSQFYSLINDLLRELLEYKGLGNAGNMTFKELENNKKYIDKGLLKIIENSYFAEFKENENPLDRKKLIIEIKNRLDS